MIVLIDNYDSFVYNLARYFTRLGQEVRVVRNRAVDSAGIGRMAPEAIVISPGPCTPAKAGSSLEIIRQWHPRIPILGICLGHQAIAEAFGGRIVRAAEPVHGYSCSIRHDGRGVFAGLPNPIAGGRYHSLVVEEASLPEVLEVSARTTDGVIMGLRHRELPVVGLQFHPESILTDRGYELLAGFLREARIGIPNAIPALDSEGRLLGQEEPEGAA